MKNSGRLYVPAVRSSQTYGTGSNYTFISNQKMKLDHIPSSMSVIHSPSFSVDESISSSVISNNVLSIQHQSPVILLDFVLRNFILSMLFTMFK